MDQDGYLPEGVRLWLLDRAERDYGGNVGRAAAAIIEGARAREMRPDDPWAELDTQRRLSDHVRHGRK